MKCWSACTQLTLKAAKLLLLDHLEIWVQGLAPPESTPPVVDLKILIPPT